MPVKTAEKHTAILDAAETIFARHGYHGAQISKIAARAGVAAGTVYLYFKNKPDILVCLFRDRLHRLVAEFRETTAAATHPAERLRRFVHHHLGSLAANWNLAVVTQIELRQADEAVKQQIGEIMKQYFQVIDEIVEEGQAADLFRREIDRRQIRNMIFGTLDQTVTAWVVAGGRFDLGALAEPTYALLTGGIAGRTGA